MVIKRRNEMETKIQRALVKGDRNSRFFHLSTLIRRRRNSIEAIKNDQGSWLRDWEDISKHVCANFQDLFSETVNQFPTDLEGLVPPCISNQDNEQICQIPTRDEIKAVIFDMHLFKAPGPDGLPAFFFKQYWPIVGDQVCAAVQNFFFTWSNAQRVESFLHCAHSKE